ncbi:MAG TPA: DUF3775 domain-containing protein [Micropepsaceae bacterium]|jgi:hypothetical protein|nr:DUF3775 domain-containing protein [Micropepsaceae bacterium]
MPHKIVNVAAERPPIEFGINTDKVFYIIAKAHMFDVKEEVSDPDSGSNASDDDMRDVLEDFADDATSQELIEYIRSLDEEEQIALVALAWVGRGTYTPEEWGGAVAEASRAHNKRTAEYLLGLPMLGDYLEESLAAFGATAE